MKCILHIGTEKTGTTSLQEFLHLNRDLLATNGVLYTKSAGLTNNRALSVAAFNLDRRDDLTKSLKIYDDKELIAYQTAIIDGLKNELRRAKNIHTVIFSSEHIHSRLRTDDELSRLKNILGDLGFDQITIVVYLRVPAEIANSLYSTAIISGNTIIAPPGPHNKYVDNLCNHRKTLVRFREKFGMEAIVPRLFSKTDLVNGSIIDDFFETIGLPISDNDYIIPEKQNKSLNVLGLELLRRINKEIPVFTNSDRPNPLRGNIISYIVTYLQDGEKYGISTELLAKYTEAFRESNEWVRAEYFPDRKVLFEDASIPGPGDGNFRPAELDRLASMISAIWLDKSRDILAVRQSKTIRITNMMSQLKRRLRQVVKKVIG